MHASLRSFATAGLLVVSCALAAQPAATSAPPSGVRAVMSVEGVDEYRLANGLQVLLVPDDSKPTTTVNLTYRVGSRHESYGETGMAHLLEHMLFKGTPTHPRAWDEFQKRGLLPMPTTSAHWLRDSRFAEAVADFLGAEGAHIGSYVDELRERNPFKADVKADPAA